MVLKVGAEEGYVSRDVPMPGNSRITHPMLAPEPPFHAVEVDNPDELPDDGSREGVALCLTPVRVFRVAWSATRAQGGRCARCDELAGD